MPVTIPNVHRHHESGRDEARPLVEGRTTPQGARPNHPRDPSLSMTTSIGGASAR